MFGSTFIPQFEAYELLDNEVEIPDLGSREMLLLFFRPSDCPSCLQNLAMFKSKMGSNVPVIGIAQAESIDEVNGVISVYDYEFPVYVSKEMLFRNINSVHSVLINRNKDVIHLSQIEPNQDSVSSVIVELNQIVNRM